MESHLNDTAQQAFVDVHVQSASIVQQDEMTYALGEPTSGQRQLIILAPSELLQPTQFHGETSAIGTQTMLIGPLDASNAAALRGQLLWLNPITLGLGTSVGLGDRLGLATPGHLQALVAAGGHIAPIPAQQSIREMTRTGRSAQQVLDDAMWGVFSQGWRTGFAADADHLKTPEDIDRCIAAGFTFYTFDPGAHVENRADAASAALLQSLFDALPWDRLADTPNALKLRYLKTPLDIEGQAIPFDEVALTRAAVKYGRAIAHVAMMYRHLANVAGTHPWEVEVSVDETDTPTTHAEHIYFATELRRLGVQWVSLAPRFVGRFEKGVDYIGDLDAFTTDFAMHAAIARALGPYKISLHSGSDKFSIYAIAAHETRGVIHLKTAGTSYLEALRTVAQLQPEVLRDIYAFAREHYETDRASYHVSALLHRAPDPSGVTDAAIPALLDQFDAREILHVTFGSVLTEQAAGGNTRFFEAIMKMLRTHADLYAANLRRHFLRHLLPFVPDSVMSTTTLDSAM